MVRFSINKVIFLSQLIILILVYIAYLSLIGYVFYTREIDLIESIWLISLGAFGIIWFSYLILSIKKFKRHIRRLFVFNLNLIFNNRIFWAILGSINKRTKVIKTIFLAYPANDKFAKEYVFESILEETRWSPWVTGFFIQNGKVGINFAISSTEIDFREEVNLDQLRELWLKMNHLRNLLDAEQMTFAGILPGIFYKKNIIHKLPIELDNTVNAVRDVVLSITNELNLSIKDTPIIVLGGKGFVGNKFIDVMNESAVYCIDIRDENSYNIQDIMQKHKNEIIVLNVANQKALEENLIYFDERVIIINEVYPEPDSEISQKITNKGSLLFHVVGVEGKAFPSFPKAYKNGIPCCASWNSSKIKGKFIKI